MPLRQQFESIREGVITAPRDAALLPSIIGLLADASPLVRAMAVWGLKRYARHHLVQPGIVAQLREARLSIETDDDVRREWSEGDAA